MLSRKISSKYRKKFDIIKIKASNVPDGDQPGGKKKLAPAKAPAQGKGKNDPGSFVPSQDISLNN